MSKTPQDTCKVSVAWQTTEQPNKNASEHERPDKGNHTSDGANASDHGEECLREQYGGRSRVSGFVYDVVETVRSIVASLIETFTEDNRAPVSEKAEVSPKSDDKALTTALEQAEPTGTVASTKVKTRPKEKQVIVIKDGEEIDCNSDDD